MESEATYLHLLHSLCQFSSPPDLLDRELNLAVIFYRINVGLYSSIGLALVVVVNITVHLIRVSFSGSQSCTGRRR